MPKEGYIPALTVTGTSMGACGYSGRQKRQRMPIKDELEKFFQTTIVDKEIREIGIRIHGHWRYIRNIRRLCRSAGVAVTAIWCKRLQPSTTPTRRPKRG